MTLLLTAVTPEGIVLGADSALTYKELGDQINLVGFNKILPVPNLHMGISVAEGARIGSGGTSSWISTWLQKYAMDVSEAESFTAFCDDLVKTLNEVTKGSDDSHTLQLAAWVQTYDENKNVHLIPRAGEISKGESGYRWQTMLPGNFIYETIEWRNGNKSKGYPIKFISSGLPRNYATWIGTVGTPEFSKLLGIRIPDPQITSVAEYVRFLIRSVAELYRISRQPAYVGEPVETLILFPDSKNMVSQRY